jgi:hypothetical protein
MRRLARPNSQGMLMRGGPDRWYTGVWGSNRDGALLRWGPKENTSGSAQASATAIMLWWNGVVAVIGP